MLKNTNYILLFFFIFLFFSCSDKNTESKYEKNPEDLKVSEVNGKDSVSAQDPSDSLIKNNESLVDLINFAVSIYNTPVLNSPDFDRIYGGKDGKSLALNKNRLVKELEYVAFPGSVFTVLEKIKNGDHYIFRVLSDEYDIVLNGTNLYIDSRFVELKDTKTAQELKIKPSKEQIYNFFDKCENARYVWGANNVNGVEKMFELYKPAGQLNQFVSDHWSMKGVDCSGLIYEATGGYTPRNTYQMVSYGEGLDIEGKSVEEIAEMLLPLDMIVWKGHVIYVYNKNKTIESAHSAGGVVRKDLISTLSKIMQTRRPVNNWSDDNGKIFVIRR